MKKIIIFTLFVFSILALFNTNSISHAKNPAKNLAKKKIEIGSKYQGGIVAYILQPDDPEYNEKETHGLIAAPIDQAQEVQWYNGTYIEMNAKGKNLSSGKSNTDTIVNRQGEGAYAAKLCADFKIDGYNDWYLPSIEELNKLFLNKDKIGGFGTGSYWSSTEDKKLFYAFKQGFFSGSKTSADKKSLFAVRAVRAF